MNKPVIVMTGAPEWAREIEPKLSEDYTLAHFDERESYVPRLADARAVMILVNGDHADWGYWTATPKSSPATRRIPIILASENAVVRRAALSSGADLSMATDELITQIRQLVQDYARVPNPETIKELDCDCEEELPPLAVEGVAKFNAREYYPQHDLFEAQWVKTESPVRDLYRAILQVGVAYYQIERGNHRGALKMLLRSVQWLSLLPDICQGVDIRQLREDSYRVRAELEAINPADIAQFDRSLLKPLKLIERPTG